MEDKSNASLTLASSFDAQDISDYIDAQNDVVSEKTAVPMVEQEHPSSRKLSEFAKTHTVAGIASHVPVSLSFRDLHYRVVNQKCCGKCAKRDTVHILKGVDGFVRPGEMMGIIGGSGSGKTTLLDILANRKTQGEIDGEVHFNGTPASDLKAFIRRNTGYVTQEDIFKGELTVRETLLFQAEMRLSPKDYTAEERKKRVEQVLVDLAIDHRADAAIGTDFKRGISGGEKKRVAVGEQLVTDPSVLFLDEPTTGLDSYNSLSVMRLLRQLCDKRGKTVIATIHQPRSTIFGLFDKLLILNKGSVVYFGKPAHAAEYFAKLGYPVPDQINPADFFIDVVLAPEEEKKEMADDDAETHGVDFAERYEQSERRKLVLEEVEVSKTDYPNVLELVDTAPFSVSYWKQFVELIIRSWKGTVRNPMASTISIVSGLVLGFIVGSIFYQLGFSQADVQNRVGVVFFIITNLAFSLAQSAAVFVEEKLLVNRQRAAGVYAVGPYFMAKTLIDIPISILSGSLAGIVIYWMANLNNSAEAFFTFLGLIICTVLASGGLYSAIGAVSPNATVANILSPLITVIFFLFAGFFVNPDSIPDWWIWAFYISFFRYSFESLMFNEFSRGQTFTCDMPPCNFPDGDSVLQFYSLENVVMWKWALVLLGMFFIFRGLAFLAVWLTQKEKR